MSTFLCKQLKEYCETIMDDPDVINFLPFHYVKHVQERAKEKGLEEPTIHKIQNVRNKRQFDKNIVDIMVELSNENKQSMSNQ